MKVLVVLDHPRRDSLTGAATDAFMAGLRAAGHAPELADLFREGFDPRMPPADEPDWNDGDKRYSDAVLAEQARVARNDAVALIFPVWWWSVPAMTKGWIDRVWNNGWAYGSRTLAGKRGMMIGIAGAGSASYVKRGYDQAMRVQLGVGILDYCGLENGGVHLLYGAIETDEARAAILRDIGALGRDFDRQFASRAAR
jgi:NAD(P)H dehydrogenase (quinone)